MSGRAARIRSRVVALLVLAGLLLGSRAHAAPHPIIVVEGSSSDPVVTRLVQELIAAGCTVRTDAPSARDAATFEDGDALLRVTPSAVEVWLVDHAADRAIELDVVGIQPPRGEHVAVTSVQVSEIVRAHLLRVGPAPASAPPTPPAAPPSSALPVPPAPAPPAPPAPAPPAPIAPAPAAVITPPPPPRKLALSLGPIVLLTPGAPPALDVALSPEWHPTRSIVLRVLVAVPIASADVSSGGNRASLSTWLAGAALDGRLHSADALWTATLGGGVAAAVSQTQGRPAQQAAYAGRSDSAVAAVPFLEVGGARALGTQRVRLGVNGMLGIAVPEITIQFAGQQVASWGLPVGAASLTLEIDLL